MSEQAKPTVLEAISQVMSEVQAVGKGDRNNEQGYNFRGIDAVINAVGPVFRKHGVVAVPMLDNATYRDVQTSKGKPSRECTVRVTYRFYGPAGDHIDATVPGESMDFGDKGAAKAMSVAYRIALLQLLTIPTHEPDADAQSFERDNDQPVRTGREVAMERGRQAIAAAADAAELAEAQGKVVTLEGNGTLSTEDAAELMALVHAREAELNGNRAPETAEAPS